MKTYAITLPNVRYGHLMPPEDAYGIGERAFCVADGITRDPRSPRDFSGLTREEILRNYVNPSGARDASEAFCEAFLRTAKRHSRMTDVMSRAFIAGNRAVHRLNMANMPRPDYLAYDLYGCVASGVAIAGRVLRWGFITDCGIVVFSKDGKQRFETSDEMRPVSRYLTRQGIDTDKPEGRIFVRRDMRNRPDARFPTYGAITGERAAETYMRFGEIGLKKGDTVVLYSDGFYSTVRHRGFFRCVQAESPSRIDQAFVPFALKLGKERWPAYGLEGTLVVVHIA